MSTIAITGGTGLIGRALSRLLVTSGHEVIILTRDPASAQKRNIAGDKNEKASAIRYVAWDIEKQAIDVQALTEVDCIVHLAGAGVADQRWTAKRKKEILESRTAGSSLLIKWLSEAPHRVKAVISASATGWYGPDPSIPNKKPFMETDPSDPGFLGETCRLWEASIDPVISLNIRLVKFRTGIVLSNEGGAFPEFKKPVRFGVAGILGSGKQMVSWIHIDDLCRMYLFAIENDSMTGVFNAIAPKPVSNKELTLQLARKYKKNFFVPLHVPRFALEIMLGEVKEEVLKSVTVCADKIRKSGFNFIFPSVENAINELVG